MRNPTAGLAALLALTAVSPMTASAQKAANVQTPDGVEYVTTVEGISEYRLGNGLKVLLFNDPSAPKVTVNLTVFVGSRHEGYGEAGMAHLLEHMLFKGTPDHPDVPKTLKDLGAQFNGTTWLDRTNYYETVPSGAENLEKAIRLEADRMVNSTVRNEDLQTEFTVVRSEFERGENSPQRVLMQRMFSAAYEWHNYGKSTIGNRADIERVPIQNLKGFYKKYYRPENAMLVVAGDFEPQTALNLVAKYFAPIENPDTPLPVTYTEEPPQDGERLVYLKRVGEVPIVGVTYHIPAGPHPDYVACDVLERVLTAQPNGILYEGLVESGDCASVSGSAFALHDPGVMFFMAELAEGSEVPDVRGKLIGLLEDAGEKITEENVEKAKRYWLKQWENGFSNSQAVATQLSDWAAQGDWRMYFLYRDRLEAVTVEDVKAAAAKYCVESNRTVGVFEPVEKPSRTSVPSTPDLKELFEGYTGREALAQGEAFDPSPANIEERTTRTELPVGAELALLPKKTRGETVNFRMTLRYGTPQSLAGKEAAASFMPALMTRGTEKYDRQQIQDILDETKTQVSATGGPGTLTLSGQTRRESVPKVMDLAEQILRHPTFPEDEFQVIQQQRVTAAEASKTDPQSIAGTALRRKMSPYEPGDVRYTPTIEESVERAKNVTVQDIKDLYETFVGAEHAQIAFVGDFDADEVKSQLAKITEGFTSDEDYERVVRTGDVSLDGKTEMIETPDKPNAVYLGGTVLPIGDSAEDYPALFVGNYILGSSGLSSRLGDRVRQQEGLSYGVGSFLQADSENPRSDLMIYAITNPANAEKVEKAIDEEISKIVSEGITEAELADAKKGYLESQKLTRSNDGGLTGVLVSTLFHDRTMDFYQQREDAISGLTQADVKAALEKYLGGRERTTIFAGDFANKAKYSE